MQALYLLALSPIAETTGDPNSYGFRIERSTADAMSQLFVCLSGKASAQWILEADIQGCFDHINHDWLLNHVPTDKVILRKWLKAGVIHKGQLQATDAGTPQGGIISPTLANMVLDGLESQLKRHLGVTRAKKLKLNVVRYADDFVITGVSPEVLEKEVKPWVEQFLAVRGLQLSGENADRPHRSGLRLPRLELPQVQREASDQTQPEERESVLRQGEGGHRNQQDGKARGLDPNAESDSARLGAVSPASGCQANVQPHGQQSVSQALALGETAAPEQVTGLDQEAIFPDSRGQDLGVRYHGAGKQR